MTIHNNPYQTKKVWPPDYKQLSWQEQLRFEKKYKRRVILASRRPKWDKGVKLVQLATTVGRFPLGLLLSGMISALLETCTDKRVSFLSPFLLRCSFLAILLRGARVPREEVRPERRGECLM